MRVSEHVIDKYFKGGIQRGTVATSAASKAIENSLKEAVIMIREKFEKIPGVQYQYKLRQDQIKGGKGACWPDGGLFFYNGKLILVSEAKKQQNKGNAIERWYKNNFICRQISPDVDYVTFCSGEGTVDGGVIEKALSPSHDSFNEYHSGSNTCFMTPDKLSTDTIYDILNSILEYRISIA